MCLSTVVTLIRVHIQHTHFPQTGKNKHKLNPLNYVMTIGIFGSVDSNGDHGHVLVDFWAILSCPLILLVMKQKLRI